MNLRAIRTSLALLGLAVTLGAPVASAQQPAAVARLTNMEGQVLVSQGDAMVAATANQRVTVGTRVLTMAGAKVVVNYDVGCDISLKENQRFTVRAGECAVLLTEVVPLGAAVAVPTAAVAGTVAIVGGLGWGTYEIFRDKSVSPN
jgi:hypothetical protein